jgi:hypothetical protein
MLILFSLKSSAMCRNLRGKQCDAMGDFKLLICNGLRPTSRLSFRFEKTARLAAKPVLKRYCSR